MTEHCSDVERRIPCSVGVESNDERSGRVWRSVENRPERTREASSHGHRLGRVSAIATSAERNLGSESSLKRLRGKVRQRKPRPSVPPLQEAIGCRHAHPLRSRRARVGTAASSTARGGFHRISSTRLVGIGVRCDPLLAVPWRVRSRESCRGRRSRQLTFVDAVEVGGPHRGEVSPQIRIRFG